MRKYTLLIVWSCFYFFGNTQSLQDAEKAYKQENYLQAISIWNRYIKDETLNKSLIYNNIGTAYASQKEWAKAILYFEKAVKQHYNNEKAQLNLKIARAKLNLSNENNQLFFVKWWLSLLDLFSIFGWQMICILIISTFSICYILLKKQLVIKTRKTPILFFALSVFTMIIIISKSSNLKENNHAIITLSDSYKYKDPNLTQIIGVSKQGEKVEILEELEDSKMIINESDSTFWVKKNSLESI
jgi:tetratricopeptide (TPR) repeat protein